MSTSEEMRMALGYRRTLRKLWTHRRSPWLFEGLWIVMTGLGFTLGLVQGIILWALSDTLDYWPLVYFSIGFDVSCAQAILLHRGTRANLLWLLAGTIGWTAALSAPMALTGPLPVLRGNIASWAGLALVGAAIGLMQWPALRGMGRRSWWWVPGNAVASLVSNLVVARTMYSLHWYVTIRVGSWASTPDLAFWAVSGAALGVIQGGVLAFIVFGRRSFQADSVA